MYQRAVPAILLLITSCQSTQSHDPSLLSFRMPEGSTLALNQKLEIPAGATHAVLQFGEVAGENYSNLYEVSCRLDFESFGPRTIQPEVFRIHRTEDGSRRASDGGIWVYYSEMHLDSDRGTDVVMLRCQRWGYNLDWHFSVAEVKTALGDYFTFDFQQPASSQPGY